MTMLVSRRQKDLVSSTQSDELMTGLNLMRKGVSSLRMAVQTQLKYPDNPQAMVGFCSTKEVVENMIRM